MGGFSLWHILIFAIILLLLFGGNRFSAMMGDVAKGLKSFKQGMSDEDEEKKRADARPDPRQLPPQQNYQQPPIDVTPEPRPAEPRPAEPTAAPPPPPTDDSAR
jgi:sec-independent protein translocase protein TatA